MNITSNSPARSALALLAAAVLSLGASAASAASGISLVTLGEEFSGSQYTLGYEFSVLDAQSVGALGVYDSGRDGLLGRAFVGLWNTDGSLLTSVIVPAGTGGFLENYFRFAPITPFVLTPGEHYIVGAFAPSDMANSWNTPFGGTAALNLHMNYFGDRYSDFDSAFSYPDATNATGGAWLGGNVYLGSLPAVPEPQAWLLMLIGFAGMGAVLRRRQVSPVGAPS